MAEQLICNQQVAGSSPIVGSKLDLDKALKNIYDVMRVTIVEGFPSWPKGADCKSVVYDFEGSNPSPSIKNYN